MSVIVRTKDRILLLKRAIESIIEQSYRNWEIILVNNGGDVNQINELLHSFDSNVIDRIRLINIEGNNYMEVATNIGLKNSSGDFIALLDDDDTWDKEFLTSCMNILLSDSSIGGVVTQTMLVYERLENNEVREISREIFNRKLSKVSLFKLLRCNLFTSNSFVYRKKLLDIVGMYDENLPVLGDWEFNIRFLMHSNIKVIKSPLAYYHKRMLNQCGDSYSNTNINEHIKWDKKIRRKYAEKFMRSRYFLFGFVMWGWGIVNHLKRKVARFKRRD
ncbi:glycosyltransferase family 2 protein [Anoxybacillus sp. J5B_2022]|uniref:glycosyltransferase family 2 protein n=1 Tax=Anoxybacillus sp. J5B_2022 TaxID=3003246 RepID=UPI0022853D1C|nr:glycosyltransferase [Anoxybacillus sp. J5B_2022]MCZ0756650.1 glycosyltransferase [Anoxybacillus sp. J5B_2022]